jgi:hypothetical protein
MQCMLHFILALQFASACTAECTLYKVLFPGLLTLVISNTLLIYFYRKRNTQVGVLFKPTERHKDVKEEQRRLRQKTLIILTICDSVLTTAGMIPLISYFAAIYISPTFGNCGGLLLAPILDGTLQITEILNFYIIFAVSKQFREMVFKALPNFCKRVFNVQTVTSQIF